MKNSRALLLAIAVAVVALAFVLPVAADGPAAYLPGLTSADKFPNGCVSCHSGDYSIPKEIAKIKGHPDVSKMVKSVPDGCVVCHSGKAGAKAPALAVAVHAVHFGPDAAKNTFVTNYSGACLNCHKFDAKTNVMGMKTGAANW